MDEENETGEEIPLGTPVLYYNQWTGLDTKIFVDQFFKLNKEETQNLKNGDVIYVDIDPLHPQGKVYGWVKVRISAIEKIPADELRIRYKGGNWAGFKTTKGGVSNDISRAKNEWILKNLVGRAPLTKEIFRP